MLECSHRQGHLAFLHESGRSGPRQQTQLYSTIDATGSRYTSDSDFACRILLYDKIEVVTEPRCGPRWPTTQDYSASTVVRAIHGKGPLPTALYSYGVICSTLLPERSRGFSKWQQQKFPSDRDVDMSGSPTVFGLPDGTRVVGIGGKNGSYFLLDAKTIQPLARNSYYPTERAVSH